MIKNNGPPIRDTFSILGLELQQRRPFGRRGGRGGAAPEKPPAEEHDRENEAIVMPTSTFEPTEIQFNGFRAPLTARYRLTFSASTVWISPDYKQFSAGRRPEPLSIYADQTPAIYRKLGGFDVGPGRTVRTLEAWLEAGETIRPDAARLVRPRPPDFRNPLAEADGLPGVAFHWMDVEGPLFDEWPTAGHRLLFGDLPIVAKPAPAPPPDDGAGFRRRRGPTLPPGVEAVAADPATDAERLMRSFIEAVYRRPVPDVDVQRFLGVVQSAMHRGFSFTDAMIGGYTAVLSSPSFLYFDERPGKLHDRALADRLAYFLWNTRPDEPLIRLASAGTLHC
jgi:hypothetical protein